jgi:tetratricopeptide (TPR) repeat protein
MNVRPLLLVVALASCAVALAASPAAAQTEETRPAPALDEANALYGQSRFQEAADLLAEAIRTGRVGGDDINRARELRARALVRAGRRLEAREGFKSLLRFDPLYRPDPVTVPPDEMDVFAAALREFQAEQVEAGRRVPASIGLFYGFGQAVNQDLVDLASPGGARAADDFEATPTFGYSVRFPINPRWSVDFGVSRLRAETEDNLDPNINEHALYEAAGTPIVVTGVWNWLQQRTYRVNLAGGLGFMASEATVKFAHDHLGRLIPVQIVGRGTGPYLHAGVEGEMLLSPRFALTANLLARYANSGELEWERPDFIVYQGVAESRLGDRSVDFSGLAAHLGVRAYIGY